MRRLWGIGIVCALLASACGGESERDRPIGAGGTGDAGSSGGSGGSGGSVGGDLCALPMDPGPCKGLVRRWYHDAATGKCTPFSYGGCEGNANNFESALECVSTCQPTALNACSAVACPSKTTCAYSGEQLVCGTSCSDNQPCNTGTCGCGSSCPACEDCIQICVES